MSTDDPLSSLLQNTQELEDFLHDFIGRLAKRELKPGTDVTRLVKQFGLEMPSALKGAKITWDGSGEHGVTARRTGERVLVLSRPGQFDAVGLTIGCIRVRRFQICLECGWFYCRIVIKGRF